MGIRVLPNLSNAACDVQTSNTISLSFGPNAAWYERPTGLPAPAFFNNLMHSSYFAADIAAGEKYIPIAIEHPPLLGLNTAGLAVGPVHCSANSLPCPVTVERNGAENPRSRSRKLLQIGRL